MDTLKVAAIAWKIRVISSENDFFGHLDELVRKAHAEGAELTVLPELPVLELLHLYPSVDETQVPSALSEHALPYQSAITKLSKELNMTIVGGSHFFASGSKIHNICVVSTPDGFASTHIKNNLTSYER